MPNCVRALCVGLALCFCAATSPSAGELDLPASVVPVVGTAGDWTPAKYSRDFQKSLLPTDYRSQRRFKALAFAPNGVETWWRRAPDAGSAKRDVLEHCAEKRGGEGCFVAAVGHKLVAPVDDFFRAQATHIDVGPDLERMVLGKADAPVVLIGFFSFTCPWCATFNTEIFDDLVRTYVDPGLVRFVWRSYSRSDTDVAAAMIARCVPADRFWDFARTIYRDREDFVESDDRIGLLVERAGPFGLTPEAARSCLDDEDVKARVLASRYVGKTQFAVLSTPTMSINGYIFRSVTDKRDTFAILDHFLAEAGIER